MATKFIVSSPAFPCPVCGRERDNDCRSKEAGNLVLCHTHTSPTRVDGYDFLRTSKDGVWGVWVTTKPKKAEYPKPSKQEFFYNDRSGSPLVKVVRINANGKKSFSQHRFENGKWIAGMTDYSKKSVPIYRYKEVREAIAAGQLIYFVEGESAADALWQLGIAATTTIGGSGGYKNYGVYKDDLEGANLVLCPDRDEEGMKYMGMVAQDFPDAMWCKVYPKSPIWQRLPKNGGLDVADWIAEGATVEDILGAVEDAPKEDLASAVDQKAIDDEAQRLTLDIQYFLKESNPVQKALTLNRICSHYRLTKQTVSDLIAAMEEANNPLDRWKFSGKSFFEQETEAIDYLIPRYLPFAESILLCSDAGVGKSALVTDMVYAILTGGEFLGEKVIRPGKCLVVSSDESPRSTRRRFIARGIDLAPVHNLEIWTRLDITRLDALEQYLEDQRPDVVFIDSITTVCQNVGISEKDPEFARYLYKLKGLVNRYNAALVVIHHANKDPLARGIKKVSGSARIPAAFWGVFLLERFDERNQDNPYRVLDMVKSRETETFKSKLLMHQRHEWMQSGIFSMEDESGKEREYKARSEQILALLQQYAPSGLEYNEISNHVGVHGNYLYRVLDRLEDARLIGKRRSATDKRRWVYFVNTPSPPKDSQLGEQYPESYTEQDSQVLANLTPVRFSDLSNPPSPSISESKKLNIDLVTGGEGVELKNVLPTCGEEGCKNSDPCTDCISAHSSPSEVIQGGEGNVVQFPQPKKDATPNRPSRGGSIAPALAFRIGERVLVTDELFDDYDRKEIRQNKEAPIGHTATVTGYERSPMGMIFFQMRLDQPFEGSLEAACPEGFLRRL